MPRSRPPRAGVLAVLLVVPATVAQLRVLSPLDVSLCADVCAGGVCGSAKQQGRIEAQCEKMMNGGAISAVGQAWLLPKHDGTVASPWVWL